VAFYENEILVSDAADWASLGWCKEHTGKLTCCVLAPNWMSPPLIGYASGS